MRRVHEFVAEAQGEGQTLCGSPVVLAVEAVSIENIKPVLVDTRRSELHYRGVARQEINKGVELDLSVIGIGGLIRDIEPVEQCSELESVFPARPNHIVAQGVDILESERLRGGVDGSELAISTTGCTIHIHYTGIETRHDGGPCTVRQTDIINARDPVGAAEREPRGIEDCGREDVILGQSDPLVSRPSQVAEITVIPYSVIENSVVNGITDEKGVDCGEILVHTYLPVVFAQRVAVVENVGRQVTAGQNIAGWNGYVRRRN